MPGDRGTRWEPLAIGRFARADRSAAAGWILLAGILTVLAWPIAYTRATASLDESWQIALHLAATMRLRYGVDIVFTFGPLGFLGFPRPYVDWTSALALVAAIVIYLSLVGTLLAGARRMLPLWAAALVTLLAARFFVYLPPFEALQALVFAWCVEALADRLPMPRPALAAAAGVVGGIAVLGKVNVGFFVVAMAAMTIAEVCRPWWSLAPSLLGRIRAALTKGPDWWVRLDDTRYRLVPATAGDGVLLAVPAAADGTGPFAFGDPIRTITVMSGQSGRDSTATLTYEFLSVPLQLP